MKKVIKTSLVLLVALIGVKVKADMGAPAVPTFKFYVSNPEGTYKYKYEYGDAYERGKYVKTDEKFSYNAEIDLICSGTPQDDVEYCRNDDWQDTYYILMSDITMIKDKFDKEDGVKLTEKQYAKVFNKNGVDLYNGPSENFYKKIGHMPYGTKFSYEYVDAGSDDMRSYDTQWAYVTYGDTSGWVYLGMPYTGKSQIAISNTSGSFMVINNNYFVINSLGDVVSYYETISTDKSGIDNAKANVNIPYGTVLNSTYSYNPGPKVTFYLVKYNGKEYWLRTQAYTDDGVAIKVNYNVKLPNEKDMYGNLNDRNVVGHVPADTIVHEIYSHYSVPGEPSHLYIEYNGVKGWVELAGDEYTSYVDDSGNETVVTDEENPEDLEEKVKAETEKKEVKKEAKKEKTKKVEKKKDDNIILYCVFGAIALAVTALVILALRTKHQKRKFVPANENEESIDAPEEESNEEEVETSEEPEENDESEEEDNSDDEEESEDEEKEL